MNRKISLFNRSISGLKKRPGSIVLATISFWVMALVSVAPSLISPAFLIVSIPFVFAPSLYQYIVVVGGLSEDDAFQLEGATSWAFFRRYFARQYQGSFRLMQGLFKGVLAFFAANFLITPIITAMGPMIWSDFEAVTKEAMTLFDNSALQNLATFVANSPTLLSYIGVLLIVELFFGYILFIHNILLYGMNIYTHAMFQSPVPAALTIVYRDTIRRNGREFRATYYGTFWPMYLLGTIGFFLGGFLGLAISYNPYVYVSMAFAMSLTFMMFYFPVYASGIGFYFMEFRHKIADYTFSRMKDSLDRLKDERQASSEDISIMEDAVKRFEENMEHQLEEETKNGEGKDEQKEDE